MIAKDPEPASNPKYARSIPFWRQVVDQGAITQDILDYPYPGSGSEQDPFVVSWLPEDARNPMRYSMWRKIMITITVSIATFVVSVGSSAYSGSNQQVVDYFEIDNEVATLGLSLFVLGFALGPLFWAPLSEFIGRQLPFFVSFGIMTALLAGCAGVDTIYGLLILRFFAGAFGSAPLTNSGGVISDMFPPEQRGLALSLFAASPFMAPALGPVIGGFLVPETYAPVLLRRRAERLSHLTGHVYRTKLDIDSEGGRSLTRMFGMSLLRPWVLLFREPIVLALSIYIAIVYGALFMMFGAFPIVYQEVRGWNQGVGGLAFMGIMVGMIIAVAYTIPDNNRYMKVLKKYNGFAPPESRLPPVILASVCIPVGLFWFAWTNGPSIHWLCSIAACVPFGFGIILIYLGTLSYLIDSYTIYAASVLAANAVMRSSFGAIFPLFTTYMYRGLGIHWASSIPAFLTVLCMPFPFLFYKFGHSIRKRCKYAAESAAHMQKLQQSSKGPEVHVRQVEETPKDG
ncbi:transporter [Aspergillus sclerotialis]|uniref:Transporter n=1 Tax=Aspergillus sclerotialis TaxID=2070753 RepID=A0A3A2ZUU7_9EURO|nr:transporter [Aspergillus sclerotialis]